MTSGISRGVERRDTRKLEEACCCVVLDVVVLGSTRARCACCLCRAEQRRGRMQRKLYTYLVSSKRSGGAKRRLVARYQQGCKDVAGGNGDEGEGDGPTTAATPRIH